MNRLQLELKDYYTNNNKVLYIKYNKLISNHISNKNRNTLKLNNKLYLKYSTDKHTYYLTRNNLTVEQLEDIVAVHNRIKVLTKIPFNCL